MRTRKFNPWPWSIALGLGVVVVVNLYVVYLSRQNAPTLTQQDYYQAGLRYEQTLDAKRASAALGWQPEVSVCPEGTVDGVCEVAYRLKGAQGEPIVGFAGALTAYRADDATQDVNVDFEEMGQGLYIAKMPVANAAYWHVNVKFAGADEKTRWLDERRVRIAPKE